MSKRRSQSKADKQKPWDFQGFIQFRPDKSQAKEIGANMAKNDWTLERMLESLLDSGIKVSFTQHEDGSIQVSLTDRSPLRENDGFILSCRSNEVLKAMAGVYWFHFVASENSSWDQIHSGMSFEW